MAQNLFFSKIERSIDVYKLISSINSLSKRNLLRGYISNDLIKQAEIEAIRKDNSLSDMMTIGALLKGKGGLLENNYKKTSSDLFKFTSFSALDWRNEIRYTVGYLNSANVEALEALKLMMPLTKVETMESDAALDMILKFSQSHGASNFLSYKLAYLRSTRKFSPPQLAAITKIEEEFSHREKPGFHFSALENLSPKISLYLIARRRVSGLIGKVAGDFRKSHALSNFIPTPLDINDLSAFLLRATESCMIDTLHAIMIILNLDSSFSDAKNELKQRINSQILKGILEVIKVAASGDDSQLITDYYATEVAESDVTLDLYRISAAFLERPHLVKFRNDLDRVIGARLLAEILKKHHSAPEDAYLDKSLLLLPDGALLNVHSDIKLDTFYRTYLFLRFVKDKFNLLSLGKSDIQFIFENTSGLENLLTESEMRAIYETAPEETQNLVSVLALALFRKKSIDPDVDFEFRTDFIAHVNSFYGGSISEFIDDLLTDSPQVAGYIIDSLDEVTLEKMYTLVTNASQAAEIRRDILKAIGKKLNIIEYVIEADAITTRSKVAKLQKYFDSSRMYVDSVAMKKWLDSNPTVSTEQYRTLYPSIEATVRTVEYEPGETTEVYYITLSAESEHLISQIAKDAFEQFCLNTEFGIQSYLGRRIRHNTLDGVTTETVDAVFKKHTYPSMKRTAEAWMDQYKAIVERLRREHLQFKSSTSLFNATMDMDDSTTKENIRLLSSSLRTTGSQLLNDLVISFCWKQITPQLENAARFIKTKLLQEATSSIDKYFSGGHGSVEEQIKIELHEAVSGVFKKVADWFQVPQTGFISASVHELCHIILYDLNKKKPVNFTGDALENKYTGISVHRLYDCIAVLLQNAVIHGEEDVPVIVNVTANKEDSNQIFDIVSIDVISTVSSEKYAESKQRINRAIQSEEAGIDMVTEGYTGIKKVKFITRKSETLHTVKCESNDERREVKISFTLHSETATEDSSTGITV